MPSFLDRLKDGARLVGKLDVSGPLTGKGREVVRLSLPPPGSPLRQVPVKIGDLEGVALLHFPPTISWAYDALPHMELSITIETDAALVDLLHEFYGDEYVVTREMRDAQET